MIIKVIKTEQELDKALARAYDLMQMDLVPDSDEYHELDVLSVLIEKYESENYPIAPPDPIEAIKFRMEQTNMSKKDLAKILKYESRVSEIFSGKRKLTLDMVKRLYHELGIPAQSLLKM
jgi:HTH-type transcriptional regulator/antitoxin HigA